MTIYNYYSECGSIEKNSYFYIYYEKKYIVWKERIDMRALSERELSDDLRRLGLEKGDVAERRQTLAACIC